MEVPYEKLYMSVLGCNSTLNRSMYWLKTELNGSKKQLIDTPRHRSENLNISVVFLCKEWLEAA